MAVLPVLRLPHRVLKQTAEDVGGVDAELARDLVDTMRASPACVGLAAPQIGVSRRAFALDVSGHPKAKDAHGLIVMFDPTIVASSGRAVGREGCMSVPDLTANVARAVEIVVRGTAATGESIEITAKGFEARAFQHEIDHLDGMLILDRVDSLASDVFRRKVYR